MDSEKFCFRSGSWKFLFPVWILKISVSGLDPEFPCLVWILQLSVRVWILEISVQVWILELSFRSGSLFKSLFHQSWRIFLISCHYSDPQQLFKKECSRLSIFETNEMNSFSESPKRNFLHLLSSIFPIGFDSLDRLDWQPPGARPAKKIYESENCPF